jgi:hypothetical protein
MNTSISADALRRAASIKDQIDQLEAEYRAILSGESAPVRRGRKPGSGAKAAAGKPGRKPGRAAKAAKAAAPEAASAEPAAKKAKKKRKLSPEARARIVAAVKARWAREKGDS